MGESEQERRVGAVGKRWRLCERMSLKDEACEVLSLWVGRLSSDVRSRLQESVQLRKSFGGGALTG